MYFLSPQKFGIILKNNFLKIGVLKKCQQQKFIFLNANEFRRFLLFEIVNSVQSLFNFDPQPPPKVIFEESKKLTLNVAIEI